MATKVEFGLFKVPNPTSIYDVLFNDVSAYLDEISINRGKSNELSAYDAADVSIKLNNKNREFEPAYGIFGSDVAPTGVVRVSVDSYVLFTGLITDWNFNYDQSGNSIAEIRATDSFWLLANLTLNAHIPADNQSSTQRIQTILLRPEVGWNINDTDLSLGVAILGGDSSPYAISQGTSVLEYLQSVEKSEPGRLFIDKNGKLAFKSRLDNIFAINYTYKRINLSSNPSFENDTLGWNLVSGTFARSTLAFYVGAASGLLSASSSVEQVFNTASGTPYTISFYARAVTSAVDTTISVYQSLSGTTWELKNSQTISIGNTWQRYSISMTTDTDYLNGKLVLATAAADGIYFDAVLIEASPVVQDYFDGSNPPANAVIDGVTYTYSAVWNI